MQSLIGQNVQRARHSGATDILCDMGITHRSAHVVVAKKLLKSTNVRPRLQQVRRKAVAKYVRSYAFFDVRFVHGLADGARGRLVVPVAQRAHVRTG